MMTVARIVRLAEQGEHDRLVGELSRNGRPVPLSVRLRLCEAEGIEAASIGLALQRIVELTFIPDAGAIQMALGLIERQRADGSFGPVGATAAAVAGLSALRRQVESMRWRRDGRDALADEFVGRADAAIERAASWLELNVLRSGLIGDAVDSTLVVWQLAGRCDGAALRVATRVGDALAEAGFAHDRVLGPLLTRAMTPASRSALAA